MKLRRQMNMDLETALRRLRPKSKPPRGLLSRLLATLWFAPATRRRWYAIPAMLAVFLMIALAPWLFPLNPTVAPDGGAERAPPALVAADAQLARAFEYLNASAALSGREIERTLVTQLAAAFDKARQASPAIAPSAVTLPWQQTSKQRTVENGSICCS